MKTLPDLIKLCADEQGKVFIMDEQGEVQLVVMGVGEYEKVKSQKVTSDKLVTADPEIVNQHIVKAQLAGEVSDRGPSSAAEDGPLRNPYPLTLPPQVSTNGAAKRDLREEVIDPSFDFDDGGDL